MALTIKQEKFCQSYIETERLKEALEASGFELSIGYGSIYYVYLLINPINDQIFYVGKGKGKRAEMHLKENRNGTLINPKKHKVIDDIVEAGLKPKIIVFQNELDESDAFTLEATLIDRFKEQITNSQNGIYGKHERNQVRAKNILLRMVHLELWLSLRKRTDSEIELFNEVVGLLKRVASGEERVYDTIRIVTKDGFHQAEIF